MPNHCYQSVEVYGPRFLVRELYEHLTKADPEFCQVVCPMPFEQWLAPKTEYKGYFVDGWYDWRWNNWGTKWDVCDVQMTGPLYLHDDEDVEPQDLKASFQFNCWTAWAPPIPVWEKLYEMGVRIHADYQDEGGNFEGRWIDGVDDTWEPEMEEEEEDA